MPSLRGASHRFLIVGEFFGFLWRRKLLWMIPMFGVTFLLGLLLLLAQSSALGPFIYTLL